MSDRIAKLNDQIQQVLSEVLSKKIEIPFEYFITVTKVRIAPDLRDGTASLSVLPFAKSEEALEWIVKNRKQIQYELGKIINYKNTPILRYKLDDSEEKTSHIYELMDKI